MTTRNQTIDDEWEQVVADGDEFLVQMQYNDYCFFAFDDSTPDSATIGHLLNDRQALLRNGIPGNLYAKAPTGKAVVVVVSDYTPA